MNDQRNLLILLLTLVAVTVLYFIISEALKNRKKYFRQMVQKHSRRLWEINNINEKYHFYELKQTYKWTKRVNTRKKCENFHFDEFFQEMILRERKELHSVIEKAITNQNLYSCYIDEINNIHVRVTPAGAKKYHVPYKRFCEIEQKICQQAILRPVTLPDFVCRVIYDSQQGRSHAEKSRTYNIESLLMHESIALEKREIAYSAESLRRAERSKMTPSLRYDILQRDGFRCTICGRTQEDGIKLEVDHIKPVAKGGKTEPSNLRTLCDICNAGKRDKYDPCGYN